MKKHTVLVGALCGVFLFNADSNSADWREGIVKRVVDGDTVKIKFDAPAKLYILTTLNYASVSEKYDDGEEMLDLTTIRLANIDAPELEQQPYGRIAKKNLSGLVLDKRIRIIEDSNYGSAGLMRAKVWLQTDDKKWVDMSERLVKDGMAWNDKFSSDDALKDLELEARKKKSGLFEEEDPVPPWVFRDKINQVKIRVPSFPRCDTSKGCSRMQNCKEAKYHLRWCARTDLDPDRDGIPCERGVCANMINFERTYNQENDD